uniref:Uncharacterized protein n=1 Tax=Trichogramma kaykai TaxID=54128 RepID=A0ABD2XMN3_9HYME
MKEESNFSWTDAGDDDNFNSVVSSEIQNFQTFPDIKTSRAVMRDPNVSNIFTTSIHPGERTKENCVKSRNMKTFYGVAYIYKIAAVGISIPIPV